MNLRAPLLRVFAGAFAVSAIAAGVAAFNFFPGPGGAPAIWPTHYSSLHASPATLAPSSFFGASFRHAADAWGMNPQSDFRWFVYDDFHDPQYGDLDGANDAFFGDLGYGILGVCYVYMTPDGGRLYDCDVVFNSNVYWGPGYYDFESVALHEQGHALGLAHTPVSSAVMYPFIAAGDQNRIPRPDDLDGETFLYPLPVGGGGGGGPPPPPSAPVRRGTMSGLTVSSLEANVGDILALTATVTNDEDGPLLLSGVDTIPATSGNWTEILMQPGEVRTFDLERTVVDVPGLNALRLHLGGIDPTMAYFAQQETPWNLVRVRRKPIPVLLQDDLVASLGPEGDERIELFLARGRKVNLDFQSLPGWEGVRTVRLLDPAGEVLRRWAPGRNFRTRSAGVHTLEVANGGDAMGTYRLFTEAVKTPPRIKGKGDLDGEAPAEIPFPAWGRTTVVLEAKGSKALAPRITALRSPSGAMLEIDGGAEVLVAEFGEDGTWTAIVEGNPGVAGGVRIAGRPSWLDGIQMTR